MSDVTSFEVTGDWRHIVDDGMVDGDNLPDEVPLTGKVEFIPLWPMVASVGSPATAYTLGPVTAIIAGGVLTDLQGRPGVMLAGKVGEHTVRWLAKTTLMYQDAKVDYPSLKFDLTENIRVTGLIATVGPGLPPIVLDPRIEAIVDGLTVRLDAVEPRVADLEDRTDAVDHPSSGKADLVDGRLDPAQLPDLAVTEFLGEVDSQAAMLDLVGERGDWCIRTDLGTTVILVADVPSEVSSWKELVHPTDAVTSVNGQLGAVILGKADVGLGNVDNTSDVNKPVSTATQTALGKKADLIGGRVPMAQAPAALAPYPMVWRTNQGAGGTFSIAATGEGSSALQWRFDGRLVAGSAPSHTWDSAGPHVVMCHLPQGLAGNLYLHSNQLTGDLSQVALPQGLTGRLHLHGNQLSGDLERVALPQGLTGDLYLHSNELTGDLERVALPQGLTGNLQLNNNQLTGDLSQVALPQGLTGNMHLHGNQLSGDLSQVALPQGLTGNLRLTLNQLTGDLGWVALPRGLSGNLHLSDNQLAGVLNLSQVPRITRAELHNNALSAAHVDATLKRIYDNRATFTKAGHSLHIGGTNAAPTGTYQAPAGGTPTGLEMVYILANDPNGEGFHKWQITYTGGTTP